MPECYSFFRSIRGDFLPLTVPSLPACPHIPLPVEETYPLLAYQHLQDIYTAFRLSASSYTRPYDILLSALRAAVPISQYTLFLWFIL